MLNRMEITPTDVCHTFRVNVVDPKGKRFCYPKAGIFCLLFRAQHDSDERIRNME